MPSFVTYCAGCDELRERIRELEATVAIQRYNLAEWRAFAVRIAEANGIELARFRSSSKEGKP